MGIHQPRLAFNNDQPSYSNRDMPPPWCGITGFSGSLLHDDVNLGADVRRDHHYLGNGSVLALASSDEMSISLLRSSLNSAYSEQWSMDPSCNNESSPCHSPDSAQSLLSITTTLDTITTGSGSANLTKGEAEGRSVSLCGHNLQNIELDKLKKLQPDFRNIEVLTVACNLLVTLPVSVFEKLVSLRVLNLTRNKLAFLDAKIVECCPNIEELILDFNELQSLPETICQLKNLKVLSCANNQLVSIPTNLTKCRQLTTLRINNNQIRCLPQSLGVLQSLQTLAISENYFSTIPTSIHQLTQLKTLTLDWFRYCAPSLPHQLVTPADQKAINKFGYEGVAYLGKQRDTNLCH